MNLMKNISANLLRMLIFLNFMGFHDCFSKMILISQEKSDIVGFNQTFDDFYENLSIAFQNTTEKYSNSTEEDIFIFKIFPAEQSYIIDDDQIINKNGQIFQNFRGIIFIFNSF